MTARRSPLPGLGISLGITLAYLGLLVVIPLSMIAWKTAELTPGRFWSIVTSDRALAALGLSLGAAALAATLNAILGLVVAWVLVRYDFPGRRLVDGLVDLPFALPTAVAGIALAATWAPTGVVGRHLHALGIEGAYSRLGVLIALTFIGLPFVVRTVQPVLESLDPRVEEAAAILGATRWQTVWRVVLPALRPAIVTGFALAFARALGEYGSVVFMSGNMPLRTEIVPLLIMSKLEQFDYAGATALALVLLVISFAILVGINGLTWRAARRRAPSRRVRPDPPDASGAEPTAIVAARLGRGPRVADPPRAERAEPGGER
jgi:sulfate transport system permease protein